MAIKLKLKEVYENPAATLDAAGLECDVAVTKGRIDKNEDSFASYNTQGYVTLILPAMGMNEYSVRLYVKYKDDKSILVVKNTIKQDRKFERVRSDNIYDKIEIKDIDLEIDLEDFSDTPDVVLYQGFLKISFETNLNKFKNKKDITIRKV